MQKHIHLLTPVTLDIEAMLAASPPEEELSPDFLRYVIHLIIAKNKHVFDRQKDEQYERRNLSGTLTKEMKFEYKTVNLSSTLLEKVRSNYSKHMKWLRAEGIVYRGSYSKGKAFPYNLAYKYQSKLLQSHRVEDYKVANPIKRMLNRHTNKMSSELKALERQLKSDRLQVKMKKALSELGALYHQEEITYDKYMLAAVGLVEIHNGTIRISQKASTDNRLHTNFTSLPKIARKFLHHNGRTLVEVDLSSSIPFILSTVLESLQKDNRIIEQCGTKVTVYHSMLEKTAESVSAVELQHFKKLILSNELYDFVHDQLAKDLSLDQWRSLFIRTKQKERFTGAPKQLRKIAKSAFLAMLFAKNGGYSEVRKTMIKFFPTILEWIKEFKTPGKVKNKHKWLSWLFFQIESFYMLNATAQTFNSKHRGRVPLYTIHDCLITTVDNLDVLVSHMQEVFREQLGVVPALKSKVWDADAKTIVYNSPSISDNDRRSIDIETQHAKAS